MAKPSCKFYGAQGEPLTERHVQAIWYDRELRPEVLRAEGGEEVRVVSPGEWNLSAGPDFRHAVIEIGNERVRRVGDVEIHLQPGDWTTHGHGTDPAYANVVVHLVWSEGTRPPSLPQSTITICIGEQVAKSSSFSLERIDLGAYPFSRLPEHERPCYEFLKNDVDWAGAVLESAGKSRLQMKADRLGRALAMGERGQVFYEEIMAALGYRGNESGFRAVARAIPLRVLRSEPANAGVALRTAGAFVAWNRGSVRPWNAPSVRLQAAAGLFTQTHLLDLMNADDFSAGGCEKMMDVLTANGYVGRGRAAAILANVIVPFAIAEGRLWEAPSWLPAEDVSSPVRLTAFRLFGRDHNPAVLYATNGLRIQGLIQIRRDFCLTIHPDCEQCSLIGASA